MAVKKGGRRQGGAPVAVVTGVGANGSGEGRGKDGDSGDSGGEGSPLLPPAPADLFVRVVRSEADPRSGPCAGAGRAAGGAARCRLLSLRRSFRRARARQVSALAMGHGPSVP
jgi:hypothetical protein